MQRPVETLVLIHPIAVLSVVPSTNPKGMGPSENRVRYVSSLINTDLRGYQILNHLIAMNSPQIPGRVEQTQSFWVGRACPLDNG